MHIACVFISILMKQLLTHLTTRLYAALLLTLSTCTVFAQNRSDVARDQGASYYMLKNADLYFSKGKIVTATEIYLEFNGHLNDQQKVNLATILIVYPGLLKSDSLAARLLHTAAGPDDARRKTLKGQLYFFGGSYKRDTIKGMQLLDEGIAGGDAYASLFKSMRMLGRGDFKESISLLKTAAESGLPQAMLYLGNYYEKGIGVSPDKDSALYWIRKSAAEGDGEAYVELADMYMSGRNVERDEQKGFQYIRLADEYGTVTYSQSLVLGNCYLYGRGTPQHTDSAIVHYIRAASHGNSSGFLKIGQVYENLKGNSRQTMDTAIFFYELARKAGNIEANRYLGNIYLSGRMVPHDYKKAAEYFREGSDWGDAASMVSYAKLYLEGKGVPKDFSRYIALLKESSGYGNSQADYLLAMTLDSTDKKTSRQYFKQAIDRGNRYAAVQYAILLKRDKPSDPAINEYISQAAHSDDPDVLIEVYRNFPNTDAVPRAEAERIFKLVSDFEQTGNPEYKNNLAKCYIYGIGTPKNWDKAIKLQEEKYAIDSLFPNYIGYLYNYKEQPDYANALKWYLVAVNKKDGDYAIATRNLFYLYYWGNGTAKDTMKASEYLMESAKAGNVVSMRMLGSNLWDGQGIKQDKNAALVWLEKAAKTGDAEAQNILGILLVFDQDSTRHDYVKGFHWIRESALQGHPGALNNLGECYYTGVGTAKDFEKARYYYQLSADKNEPVGKLSLGVLYQKGDGVPVDKEKARSLFESACKDNFEEACKLLKEL